MKILVYDDNLDFGGHQIMACRGIEALAAVPALQISVIYHPQNTKLVNTLQQITPVEAHPVADNLIRQFKSLSPDRVVCIQGNIRQSTQGIDTARKLGITCISYIAIAHPMSQTGAKFGTIRDRLSQHRINRADIYITISDSMKNMLLKRKTKAPIHVVRNGIPYPPIPELRISKATKTIGVIGRLEFKQKQQDFMVRAFQEQSDMLKNCRLLFTGNGPDEKRLKLLIKDASNISLFPWTDDIESFYDQIDLLAIPSRYEGVPLVLLEALARGIPVIASATDGMQEILPKSWTFDSGSTASMAWAFTEVANSWQAKLEDLQQTIVNDYSIEMFNRNFVKSVIS